MSKKRATRWKAAEELESAYSPEKALLVAVLARALLDLSGSSYQHTLEDAINANSPAAGALRWFMESESASHLFTFRDVCHHLGLNEAEVRKRALLGTYNPQGLAKLKYGSGQNRKESHGRRRSESCHATAL